MCRPITRILHVFRSLLSQHLLQRCRTEVPMTLKHVGVFKTKPRGTNLLGGRQTDRQLRRQPRQQQQCLTHADSDRLPIRTVAVPRRRTRRKGIAGRQHLSRKIESPRWLARWVVLREQQQPSLLDPHRQVVVYHWRSPHHTECCCYCG